MADKQATVMTGDTDPVVLKAKNFWDKYSKMVTYVGLAIILGVGGWYSYQNFIKLPKEKSASDALFAAENLFGKMANTGFNKDSVGKVLNGGELDGSNITGVLKVIKNYGGTKAGNRAQFIAGACYLHIKEFDKAIKHLKDFDGNNADQLQSRAYVMIGNAYAEKGNNSEAMSYFKKAATVNSKDEFISSEALMTAAMFADATNNEKDAVSILQEIKEKYPSYSGVKSGEVDKLLAKYGILK